MSRGRQRIRFEGLLQKNVLGSFKVIRGFADLRALAHVSVAMEYQFASTSSRAPASRSPRGYSRRSIRAGSSSPT